MEIMNGCIEVSEPIRLNYEDPFLSNEAKNSLLEKERKPKSDKPNRHPDENLGDQSIRSDIQELKRIMQSMKEGSRRDRPNNGFNPSYRQNIPNE